MNVLYYSVVVVVLFVGYQYVAIISKKALGTHIEPTKTLLLQLEKVKYFCKRNNNINKLNQKRGNGGTTNAQRQVTTHCLILAPAALLKHQPI